MNQDHNSQANERSQLAWLGVGLLVLAVLKYALIGASLFSVCFLIFGAIFLISAFFFRKGGRPTFIIVKKVLHPIAKIVSFILECFIYVFAIVIIGLPLKMIGFTKLKVSWAKNRKTKSLFTDGEKFDKESFPYMS